MGTRYYRRFRMEINLRRVLLPEPVLPDGYYWCRFEPTLIDRHASVNYGSFHSEIDGTVFPCLADVRGCRMLMRELVLSDDFLPGATWLISRRTAEPGLPIDCGTIQGLATTDQLGSIQNVGVVRTHRGLGLGKALVLKALDGFKRTRRPRVSLEVTADNRAAVALYQSLGFERSRTLYRPIRG